MNCAHEKYFACALDMGCEINYPEKRCLGVSKRVDVKLAELMVAPSLRLVVEDAAVMAVRQLLKARTEQMSKGGIIEVEIRWRPTMGVI